MYSTLYNRRCGAMCIAQDGISYLSTKLNFGRDK